jgi:hypothetical protein
VVFVADIGSNERGFGAFVRRERDAVGIVGGIGSDPDVIEGPSAGRRVCSGGHGGLTLPDPRDGAQRRIGMIGIEIENCLEQDERHTVEANRVVAEPAPGQLRSLSAAETIRPGVLRVGVVQIAFDRPLPLLNLRRPVGHDLTIDPRDDLVAGIALQRGDEASLGPFGRGGVLRIAGGGVTGAVGGGETREGNEREFAIPRHRCSTTSLQLARTPNRKTVRVR